MSLQEAEALGGRLVLVGSQDARTEALIGEDWDPLQVTRKSWKRTLAMRSFTTTEEAPTWDLSWLKTSTTSFQPLDHCLVKKLLDNWQVEAITATQWAILERVGRARYHGEVTQGRLSLQAMNVDPKTLFYHR